MGKRKSLFGKKGRPVGPSKSAFKHFYDRNGHGTARKTGRTFGNNSVRKRGR